MRKHLGNTEETLTLKVSECFPVYVRTHATYVEDVKFASHFCFLLVCLSVQQREPH